MTCGLCESEVTRVFYEDTKKNWTYFVCDTCQLVFRDPHTFLSHEDEKQRYTTHDNGIENQGYVNFLRPVVTTLRPYLKAGDQGLDFGSGPGPILDQLFAEENISVKNYDPYFDYHPFLLDESYDFVTCTETFEHFSIPFKEMVTMTACLKPQGYLLIMTEMYPELEDFANWGYRQDPTHVTFLSPSSLQWLAEKWGYDILNATGRIFLLQKKS
jgi:hypothetical protein